MDPIIQTIRPRTWKKWAKRFIFLFFLLILIIAGILFSINHKVADKIFTINSAPKKQVAVVFGAGLKFKDWPGDFLKDRILIALELYKEGKVEKILMSGDSADLTHDEVKAMVNFAVTQGLKSDNLILDPLGLSTFDTCKRLKNIFKISDAILVTQSVHLTRALYVCNKLGVDAAGVAADLSDYSGMWKFKMREFFASLAAWWLAAP
ncbi:YdcF family protein [Candidatus Falkowbacteria bacterium]|nr:YdcF family protein [Candidatus Falkowbacteria bacterium]